MRHLRQPSLATFLLLSVSLLASQTPPVDAHEAHPRAAILSDIGNEPDDQMSLVRLLLYSNQIDIRALIASTSVWQKNATHPETMRTLVAAYGESRDNLMRHEKGWPTAENLLMTIHAGQPAYGMAAVGAGRASDGSRAMLEEMRRDDARPLWICLWGGANTLAQALLDARAQMTSAELTAMIARLRVYSISDQDDAGAWIRREFPGLFYIVSPSSQDSQDYSAATWTGISGDNYYRNGAGADATTVSDVWLREHIRVASPLGKHYLHHMFIMEGDTPSFLGLIDNGLENYRRPDWGGWGGRYLLRAPRGERHAIWTQGGDMFGRIDSRDEVMGVDQQLHNSDQATIWRWRADYQNDFAMRMSWTLAANDYAHAQHPPQLVVNGREGSEAIDIDAYVGEPVRLDARSSHSADALPLHYRWFVYREAGAMDGRAAEIKITEADSALAQATATNLCRPLWLPYGECKGTTEAHMILAVSEDGPLKVTRYRRIILHVREREKAK